MKTTMEEAGDVVARDAKHRQQQTTTAVAVVAG
jgi:hypothetical protein